MLNSNKDRSILRYLAQVGELKYKSTHFASRYYDVKYNDQLVVSIRFSDHFHSDSNTKVDIEIVKTSFEYYIIKLLKSGITYTVTENAVLHYIKSILLLYPEITDTLLSYKNATDTAINKANKMANAVHAAEMKLLKRDELTKMVDDIYQENLKFRSRIGELSKELTQTKKLLEDSKSAHETTKKKLKELSDIKDKLNRLKTILNTIK